MAFTEISLIDIGHRGAEADRECAQTLRDVCHRVGFFYVQNHGLSEQTAAGYLNAARQFFALPFVADLDADVIDGNLTCDEQIRYFATGNGFLGTSLD